MLPVADDVRVVGTRESGFRNLTHAEIDEACRAFRRALLQYNGRVFRWLDCMRRCIAILSALGRYSGNKFQKCCFMYDIVYLFVG